MKIFRPLENAKTNPIKPNFNTKYAKQTQIKPNFSPETRPTNPIKPNLSPKKDVPPRAKEFTLSEFTLSLEFTLNREFTLSEEFTLSVVEGRDLPLFHTETKINLR